MSPPEESPSPPVRVSRNHAAAGSRRYRSKAQRPCDLCRARKALCNIPDPSRPCQLCDRTGRQCTFLAGAKSRPMRSSPSRHSVGRVHSLADHSEAVTTLSQNIPDNSADLSRPFRESIGEELPAQWPAELELLGQSEVFMQDIPGFWPLDASVVEAGDPATASLPNEASLRPGIQTTLSRNDRSTSFIGYSNESDPFLLENYPYDVADELDFFMVTYRRPSLESVSAGHPPIHFLQSKPQAVSESQAAITGCLAIKDERKLLSEIVSADMGVALLRL